MTQTQDQTHSSADPRLAPLLRADLPSFLLRIEDGLVVRATAACADMGLAEGGIAPNQLLELARSLVANRRPPLALVRLQLPLAPASQLFHCTLVKMLQGPAMLFADSQASNTTPMDNSPTEQPAPATVETSHLQTGMEHTGEAEARDSAPVRFTFAADAQNRLSGLSSTLMRALGEDAAHWHGATFAELEAAGRIVSAREITQALASRGSFIGARVTTHGPIVLDLELGGVPLFDLSRRRIATRGFGVLRTWAESSTSSWIRSLEPATARPATASLSPPAKLEPFDGTLSPSESETFRDIGRTLQAVMSQGTDTPLPDTPLPDELPEPASETPLYEDDKSAPAAQSIPVAAASITPPAGQMNLTTLDLMDALPFAVLLEQDGVAIHANNTFFHWTGWPDLNAFRTAGGMAQVCLPDEDATINQLTTADDTVLTVETRLVEAPFIAPQTRILMMRRMEEEAVHPVSEEPASSSASTIDTSPAPEFEIAPSQPDQALNMVPWPVLLLNRDCLIRFANSSATQMLDYAAADLVDQPFTLLLPVDAREDGIRWLDDASSTAEKTDRTRILQVQPREGRARSLFAGIAALDAERYGQSEQLLCLVLGPEAPIRAETVPASVVQDTPEVTVQPEEPEEKQPQDIALGHLAQRLRESLGPAFSTLLDRKADAAPMSDDMKTSLRQVQQCFTDLAALGAPQNDAPLEICLPAPVLHEALMHVTPSARRRRITLRTDIEETPAIRTHPAHLARLMRLLLEEALDATPASGSVVASLTCDMEQDSAPVRLEIADEGEPLDEVALAAATQPQAAFPQGATLPPDRFSKAGHPLRFACLQAAAEEISARLSIRRGQRAGMHTILDLPR